MDRKYIKPYDQKDLKEAICNQFGDLSVQYEVFLQMAAALEEHGVAPAEAKLRVTNKVAYCDGCYNDHYNFRTQYKYCWSLKDAKIIPRKRVHINDRPPWNHTPELYPSCYREPQYVFVREKQTH